MTHCQYCGGWNADMVSHEQNCLMRRDMESDIDISKSPKEVFLEGLTRFTEESTSQYGFSLGNRLLLWKLAGQPAVNSVRFEFQDWMDGLEASLIKLSRPKPDLAIATLEKAIEHLTDLRNQYLAEKKE